jgi:hypothetical protein
MKVSHDDIKGSSKVKEQPRLAELQSYRQAKKRNNNSNHVHGTINSLSSITVLKQYVRLDWKKLKLPT